MLIKTICNTRVKDLCRFVAAIGVVAIAIPAHAQSSVQLYGIVDAWAGYLRLPGKTGAAEMGGGGLSTSFWGLGGHEDLGGGYQTLFAVEGFFRPQSGQYGSFNGDSFFSRNAFVGVASPYGTLTLGQQSSLLYLQSAQFNPFYASFTFSPTINQLYAGLGTYPSYRTAQGIPGGTSWGNAVQYATTSFNGLVGRVMYAFGDQAGDDRSKKVAAQATFTRGALAVGATWQYLNFSSAPGDLGSLLRGFAVRSQTAAQLGASYDAHVVKLFGEYTYADNQLLGSSYHVNMLQGGAAIALGLGRVLVSYAYSRDDSMLNQMRRTASLSYDYPLSRRTDVYAGYMYDRFSGLSTGSTVGAGVRTRF